MSSSIAQSKRIVELGVVPDDVSVAIPVNMTYDEQLALVDGLIRHQGLHSNHLNSFDELMTSHSGIKQIITEGFKIDNTFQNKLKNTEEDRQIETINFTVQFPQVRFDRPTISGQGRPELLFPYMARRHNRTLCADMRLDVYIKATAVLTTGEKIEREAVDHGYMVGQVPIMVRSKLCNTHGNSRDELLKNREDPNDEGGYFIVKGREAALNLIDSILYNEFHPVKHKPRHENESSRGIFISKPGDAFENSTELILRYEVDGALTIEMNSPQLKDIRIPFYLVYRMLGMSNDLSIIETVVYDARHPSKLTQKMVAMLMNAITIAPVGEDYKPIRNSRNPTEILAVLAERAHQNNKRKETDNEVRAAVTHWFNLIDKQFFPHVGVGQDTYIKRLRFFGYLIRTLLLVELGIIQEADKDHYRGKRVHSSGFTYAKTIKHDFNAKIIKPVRARFASAFQNTSFSNVNLLSVFRSSIEHGDLRTALEESIMLGRKPVMIGRQEVTKSVSSQDIQRKNHLNVTSTMRTIATTGQAVASQSERAIDMRSVHPSYTSIICPAQSADTGEKVGRQKQLAVCSIITSGESSQVLERIVLDDPDMTNFDTVESRDIIRERYHFVFVNNRQVAVTKINPYILQRKYQLRRRAGEIHAHVTVCVDPLQMNLQFWCDRGRPVSPHLVVVSDPTSRESPQDLAMTRAAIDDFIAGRLSIADLLKRGYFEYLAPAELENCLVAERYGVLAAARTSATRRYTHCDMEVAISGLPALVAPFADHTQTQRITMLTNHARQACSLSVLNFADRADKNLYVQFEIDEPLVPTLANRFTYPTGKNMTLMLLSAGDNQEDSARFNQATNDHQCMSVLHYTFEMTVIEKDEQIMNPSAANTLEKKPGANYEKIINGLPRIGTRIVKDDIVIGKVLKMSRENGQYKYVDRSIKYNGNEEAVVADIISSVNDDLYQFTKVVLRSVRDITEGDKCASRLGNKSIIGNIAQRSDLWYTARGLVPDVVINPHAIPTRMILGQLMESVLAKLAARRGTTFDATIFRPHDFYEISSELAKYGINGLGLETVYNGITGERLQAMIFTCPTFYQRLQKFVIDEMYSVVGGSTDAVTRQPLRGKNVQGGLRNGEMEKDTMCTHGGMYALREKFMDNSDGTPLFWCYNCGMQAIYNADQKLKRCKRCKDKANIKQIPSAWMTNITIQKLEGASVNLKARLERVTFEKQ